MRPTIYLETFGCQMNELDSELVEGQLRALGYRFTNDADDAGVILYNTCSVREHAEQKVWSRLGELDLRKRGEPTLVVGVLGCMAERDGKDLIRRMPVVDVMCGPGELDKLPALLDNALRTRESLASTSGGEEPAHRRSARQIALQGNSSRRSSTLAAAQDTLELLDLSRSVSPVDAPSEEGGHTRRSAYVRITRGCNKFCTYCVVPFTRGAEVHRPPEHILDECKRLADAGVIEITLLGQTVNHYRFEHGAAVSVNGIVQPQKGRSYQGGHRRDPYRGENVTTFADLLRRIHDEVPTIQRLRFVTSYPRDFGDDVLEVIRDHPRLCRYLHVPAQSGSNRILKAMNRGYEVAEYLEFLDRARAFLHEPERGRPLGISGDFIVGFPGETDEDFEATQKLLTQARYKNAFIFKYSPRPGTPAHDRLEDDVPEETKRRRNVELLSLQTRISEDVAREWVGHTTRIMVEGISARDEKRLRRRQLAHGDAHGLLSLTIDGKRPVTPGSELDQHADHVADACCGSTCAVQEEPQTRDSRHVVQCSGRTDTDQIVLFDVASVSHAQGLVGRMVPVRIERASALSCFGTLAEDAP